MILDTFVTPDAAIRLHHVEAEAFLAAQPSNSFDLVVTSPPFNMLPTDTKRYGLRAERGRDAWLDKIGRTAYADNLPEPVYQAWLKRIVAECLRVSRGVVCVHHKCRGQDSELSHPMQFLGGFTLWNEIIWDRGGTAAQNCQRHPICHEVIYVFGRGGKRWWNQAAARHGSVWRVAPETGCEFHPCPWPLEIPLRLIEGYAPRPGMTVLDPFAGRGTTLLAAARLGMVGVGCEIREDYFEAAKSYFGGDVLFCGKKQLEIA